MCGIAVLDHVVVGWEGSLRCSLTTEPELDHRQRSRPPRSISSPLPCSLLFPPKGTAFSGEQPTERSEGGVRPPATRG